MVWFLYLLLNCCSLVWWVSLSDMVTLQVVLSLLIQFLSLQISHSYLSIFIVPSSSSFSLAFYASLYLGPHYLIIKPVRFVILQIVTTSALDGLTASRSNF